MGGEGDRPLSTTVLAGLVKGMDSVGVFRSVLYGDMVPQVVLVHLLQCILHHVGTGSAVDDPVEPPGRKVLGPFLQSLGGVGVGRERRVKIREKGESGLLQECQQGAVVFSEGEQLEDVPGDEGGLGDFCSVDANVRESPAEV